MIHFFLSLSFPFQKLSQIFERLLFTFAVLPGGAGGHRGVERHRVGAETLSCLTSFQSVYELISSHFESIRSIFTLKSLLKSLLK